jgi:hypothetical protein
VGAGLEEVVEDRDVRREESGVGAVDQSGQEGNQEESRRNGENPEEDTSDVMKHTQALVSSATILFLRVSDTFGRMFENRPER